MKNIYGLSFTLMVAFGLFFSLGVESVSAIVTFSNPTNDSTWVNSTAVMRQVTVSGSGGVYWSLAPYATNVPCTNLTFTNTGVSTSTLYFDFETQNNKAICATDNNIPQPWKYSNVVQKVQGIFMEPVDLTTYLPSGIASNTVTPLTTLSGTPITNAINLGIVKPHSPYAYNIVPTTSFTVLYDNPRTNYPVSHYSYKWADHMTDVNLSSGVNACSTNGSGIQTSFEENSIFDKVLNFLFPKAFANPTTPTYLNTPIDFSNANIPIPSTIFTDGTPNILCVIATNSYALSDPLSQRQSFVNSAKLAWKQDVVPPTATVNVPLNNSTVASGVTQFTVTDGSGVGFNTNTLSDFQVKFYTSPGGVLVSTVIPVCSYSSPNQEHTVSCTATPSTALVNGVYQVKITAFDDDLNNAPTLPVNGPIFTVNTALPSPVQKLIILNYDNSGGDRVTFRWARPSGAVDYTFYYQSMVANPTLPFATTVSTGVNIPLASMTSTNIPGVGLVDQYTLDVASLPNAGNTYYYTISSRGAGLGSSNQSPIAFRYGDITDVSGTLTNPTGITPDYLVTYFDAWKIKILLDNPSPGIAGLPSHLRFAADVSQDILPASSNTAGNFSLPDSQVTYSDAWRVKYHVDNPTAIYLPNY